eukprot:2927648-Rhodomonas_salina.2
MPQNRGEALRGAPRGASRRETRATTHTSKRREEGKERRKSEEEERGGRARRKTREGKRESGVGSRDLGEEALLELGEELEVEEIVGRQRLLADHRLHRRHVLADGVVGVHLPPPSQPPPSATAPLLVLPTTRARRLSRSLALPPLALAVRVLGSHQFAARAHADATAAATASAEPCAWSDARGEQEEEEGSGPGWRGRRGPCGSCPRRWRSS